MNDTTTSQHPGRQTSAIGRSHPTRPHDPVVAAMLALTVNGIGFSVVDTRARQTCETCSKPESLAAA